MKKKKILLGPVITILILMLVIIVVSAIASAFGLQGEITAIANGTLETSMVSVKSIFSEEGLKYLFTSPVQTFQTFKPLVLLVIALMAISIGKASGLFKAIFVPLRKLKPYVITFLTLFVGIISSFFSDYGYFILLPLTAIFYQYIGRNSVLGILTSFVGITLGYGAGLVFTIDDYQLGLLTKEAATVSVDADYEFNAWSAEFIMVTSTIVLAFVGTLIVESFLKPRVKESIKEEDNLIISKKGLVFSTIAFVILLGLFIYMIIPGLPGSGILLDMSQKDYVAQLLGGKSPFGDAFIFMLLIMLMVASAIYGFVSKNINNTNEFSVGLSKEFDDLGYIFILMFFASLMFSILTFTNLGQVVGAWLISFMSNLEFTGLPLVLIMFFVIVLMSFFIPDTVTKWTIASPILVPLFMKSNITPDFTQFIFKAADSAGKGFTPFFVYFIVMLALLEKYNGKESVKITIFGTLRKLLPTILLCTVVWIVILIGWFIIGLPLGPDTYPTM
ncbi:MAG: hypothetical protein HFH47_02435 [Bacilli bacterium]|nr:hypothetical protein [Bacilli bacterium]